MLASKEHLLAGAFALTRPLVDTSLAEELNQKLIEDLALFQTFWTELQAKRCLGLKVDFANQTLTLKLLKA
ncbi:MAG: hypothetical protein N2Z22_12280, partial [Turneriella sp.]|nr:hypothetical protein [Turneriella sp.]